MNADLAKNAIDDPTTLLTIVGARNAPVKRDEDAEPALTEFDRDAPTEDGKRNGITLRDLRRGMTEAGVKTILVKKLSLTDNSKNQIYLGSELTAMKRLPYGKIEERGTSETKIQHASLDLLWLLKDGTLSSAPNAKLILYPRYPEVRMSGFLLGCRNAPREFFRPPTGTNRRERPDDGRLLILGIAGCGRIIACAIEAESLVAEEIRSLIANGTCQGDGVFLTLPPDGDEKSAIARIAELGRGVWHRGIKLGSEGNPAPYFKRNAVGLTLEALLGIRANSKAGPDLGGREIKATAGGVVTLLTHEPDGGVYADEGATAFVERYGLKNSIKEVNFNGRHDCVGANRKTRLRLGLSGYDAASGEITDFDGKVTLAEEGGIIAASWSFRKLFAHWAAKHASTICVKASKKNGADGSVAFRYDEAIVCDDTDAGLLLAAIADGRVFYDPGLKIRNYDPTGANSVHRRNQFRTRLRDLPGLYRKARRQPL